MKQKCRTIICLVLAGLLGMFCGDVKLASAQKTIKLKYAVSHGAPNLTSECEAAASWQEEVTKRTNGAITFENFWGGALGAPAEYIEMLKSGAVQVASIYGWYTPSKLPFANFEHIFPFSPTDYEMVIEAKRRIRKEIPQFEKEMTQNNLMLIADISQLRYFFMSKEPLTTVDNFKGLKVGIIGRYFGRWLPPGSTPVVRPAHDRYDLLKTGVTSADLNPLGNLYLFKIYEVTRYVTTGISLHVNVAMPLMMNRDAFNSLSPEFQKIILDAGRNVEMRAAREINPKWDAKILAKFKESGVQFAEFKKGEVEKWAAMLEDIPAEWAAEMEAQGLPGFKTVQRYQEITAALGYKWARQWGIKK